MFHIVNFDQIFMDEIFQIFLIAELLFLKDTSEDHYCHQGSRTLLLLYNP